MKYYRLWCNKCGVSRGRFEEKFRDSIQVGKCGVCLTVLEVREE